MKKRICLIALSIILLIIAFTLRIGWSYNDVFTEFAEASIKPYIKSTINNIITENINLHNVHFNEITSVNRDKNGTILSISINTALLNTLIINIENDVIETLSNETINISLPLGNLFNSNYLSGKGPTINVNIISTSTNVSTPKSELISSGINQTLHRVTVDFETSANCVAPFQKASCTIKTTIVISETLIIGEVPKINLSSG